MKKKRNIALIINLGFAVVTGGAFYAYSNNMVKPTPIYQFSHDLTVNSKVTSDDIKVVKIAKEAVSKNNITEPKDILGKYVKTDVYANNDVYTDQLTDVGKLDPFKSMDMSKYRKISLPISLQGFDGNIKRGDKVDLVFVGEGNKTTPNGDKSFKFSKVFLQDLPVFDITTDKGYKYDNNSNKVNSDNSNGNGNLVVTVAVTLDQAEEISARLSAGKVYFLSRFDNSKSYETLGYVFGDYQKVFSGNANAETGISTVK